MKDVCSWMDVYTKLVILSVNVIDNHALQIVSCKKDEFVIPTNPWEKLNNICSKYLDLDFDWISPKLCDVYESDKNLYVVYGAIVPPDVVLVSGYWFNPNNIINTDDKSLILNIVNKIN